MPVPQRHSESNSYIAETTPKDNEMPQTQAVSIENQSPFYSAHYIHNQVVLLQHFDFFIKPRTTGYFEFYLSLVILTPGKKPTKHSISKTQEWHVKITNSRIGKIRAIYALKFLDQERDYSSAEA